jgi:hypothetical protein
MKKLFYICALLILSIHSHAQILGGGTLFSHAITFNPTWITACPGGGATLSNQSSFEPATAMDPCAPAPACATGTTGSDVWFSFFAQATTATIVAEPSASFDIGIQAFSGSTCPGLVNIGCIDANGNNTKETLVHSTISAFLVQPIMPQTEQVPILFVVQLLWAAFYYPLKFLTLKQLHKMTMLYLAGLLHMNLIIRISKSREVQMATSLRTLVD